MSSQMRFALLLSLLMLRAVVKVRRKCSGDNHVDNNTELGSMPFRHEISEHVSSLTAVRAMVDAAKHSEVGDKLTLAAMIIFGRRNANNLVGGQYNGEHVGNILTGANVAPAVIGGVVLRDDFLVAQDVNAVTGSVAAGGDVPTVDTLTSYGIMLGRRLGLDAADVIGLITGAKSFSYALSAC